jgi:hypothetical protein
MSGASSIHVGLVVRGLQSCAARDVGAPRTRRGERARRRFPPAAAPRLPCETHSSSLFATSNLSSHSTLTQTSTRASAHTHSRKRAHSHNNPSAQDSLVSSPAFESESALHARACTHPARAGAKPGPGDARSWHATGRTRLKRLARSATRERDSGTANPPDTAVAAPNDAAARALFIWVRISAHTQPRPTQPCPPSRTPPRSASA